MAVTKQTYTLTSGWTAAGVRNMFRGAFIDAGLMTDWHDSFTTTSGGGAAIGVMEIAYNAARVYGRTYYCFNFRDNESPGVTIANSWGASVPLGAQFVDYHIAVGSITGSDNSQMTRLRLYPTDGISPESSLFLDRYTSTDDARQSWFVIRQGTLLSQPFSFLHKDTSLHPWLDLDKGMISGFSTVQAAVFNRQGFISFQLQECVRRCLLIGSIARSNSATASGIFHAIFFRTHSYTGVGSSTQAGENFSSDIRGGAFPLPIGKASINPAFLADYVPICTNLPWSPFTPTRLAEDFAVYMHYSDNTTVYGDRFIAQAGINEWEAIAFSNNGVVIDGASPTFLARVV